MKTKKLTIGELQVLGGCWCSLRNLGEKANESSYRKMLSAMNVIDSAFYEETDGALLNEDMCGLNTTDLKEWIEKRRKEVKNL